MSRSPGAAQGDAALPQSSILDPNLIVGSHLVEQFDDFEVVHLYATGAGRCAEAILVIRAVNINVAGVAVHVAP